VIFKRWSPKRNVLTSVMAIESRLLPPERKSPA
jgi:hypothetical protein